MKNKTLDNICIPNITPVIKTCCYYKVAQFDITSKFIILHDNASAAAKYMKKVYGYEKASSDFIRKACKFVGFNTAYGFQFRYVDDNGGIIEKVYVK